MKKLPALVLLIWVALLITVMQLYALSQGVDGTLFSLSVGSLMALGAGFAGFKWRR